ncbi:1197_t:CDS:2, partial [Dentiscutata heterogama]
KSTQKNSKDNVKNSDLHPSKNVANNEQPSKPTQSSKSSSKNGTKESNNEQPPKQTQPSKSSPKNGDEKSNVQSPQVSEKSTSEQTQISQKYSKDNTKAPDKISQKPTPTFQKGSSQNNAKESPKPTPALPLQNDIDKLSLKPTHTQNDAKPSFEKDLKQTPTSSQNDVVNQKPKPTPTLRKGDDAKISDKLPLKPTSIQNDAKPSFEKGLKQTPTSSQNDVVNQIPNPTPTYPKSSSPKISDKLPLKPTLAQNNAKPSFEKSLKQTPTSSQNDFVNHISNPTPTYLKGSSPTTSDKLPLKPTPVQNGVQKSISSVEQASSRTTPLATPDAVATKPLNKIATLLSSTTIPSPQKNEANTMNTKATSLPGATPYIDSSKTALDKSQSSSATTKPPSIDATNTPHLPDAAAEKTLNKATTLSPSTTRPPRENDAIPSSSLTTTSKTAPYIDSYAKTALTKTTTPTGAPYLDSFTGKTKPTTSATANAPLDAIITPQSMTTTKTHLDEIALVTKSNTLTATSTTMNNAIGPIFPIPRGSTTAELPTPSTTPNPEKITDYQSTTRTKSPRPTTKDDDDDNTDEAPPKKTAHKDKPYIPVITGSLPIAPMATEPAKNTAPPDDNLPSVIVTSTDPSSYSQPNTSRFTIKINLLWPSVVNDPEYPPILCNVLPNNIADFFDISSNKINVTQLKRAPDDNTCLADVVVATSNGDEIIKTLSNPSSKFYTGVSENQKIVNKLVNPKFPMALQANSAENAQTADQNFNTSSKSSSGTSSPLGAIVVVAVVGSTLLYAGLTALVVRAYKRNKNRESAIRQDS